MSVVYLLGQSSVVEGLYSLEYCLSQKVLGGRRPEEGDVSLVYLCEYLLLFIY